MISIVVKDRAGAERVIETKPGLSLMEAIRSHGTDSPFALCGGCCSCATCHVYVDPAFVDALPAMEEGEQELLDFSEHRTERSRLSCQLPLATALDGLRVEIAPAE